MNIESPVKKFPGYVVLPDYLNAAQVMTITDAFGDPNKLGEAEDKKVWAIVNDAARLPALFACVSEWHITGVPDKPSLQTFPMSPLRASHDLVAWLFGELVKLWNGEEEIPNA